MDSNDKPQKWEKIVQAREKEEAEAKEKGIILVNNALLTSDPLYSASLLILQALLSGSSSNQELACIPRAISLGTEFVASMEKIKEEV